MSPTSTTTLLELAKSRRTIYQLKETLPVPPDRIRDIVSEAILHVPSPYNCQANRVLILFNGHHKKLWAAGREAARKALPPPVFERAAQRLDWFEAAAGTVLFFEDSEAVKTFQEKFPFGGPLWPEWAAHSDGMLQYLVWTALEAEELGANLQHLNPLIDAAVAEAWGVPETWKLHAQLVFGERKDGWEKALADKTFEPVEGRVKVFE